MKLTTDTTWVGLDDRIFPKNTLCHEVKNNEVKVEKIDGTVICDFKSFDQYKASNGTPYANVGAVDTAFKGAFYTLQA